MNHGLTVFRVCGFLIWALSLPACASSSSKESSPMTPDASPVMASQDMMAPLDGALDSDGSIPLPGPNECRWAGTPSATAPCVIPNRAPEYYIAEAEAYFDTLDLDADRESVPDYHPQVIRWEWPPWLLLTGYTAEDMILTSDVLRGLDPSTVPVRDCRFFDRQPFARCYVEFEYERGRCPIYEEFSFDANGQMTFIEAWSDLPGLLPNGQGDRWAETPDFPRLGNRVPGLGASPSELDFMSPLVLEAMAEDNDLATLAERTGNWRQYWFEELQSAEEDFFGVGCGWPPMEASHDETDMGVD